MKMCRTPSSPRLALLGVLALLCAAPLAIASPAFALRGHAFGKSFGSPGAGEGQFSGPQGIAVNEETGDVYVVDRGNSRVERFTEEGGFLSEFNGAGTFERDGKVETGLAFARPTQIAVDNSCKINGLTETTTPKCATFDPSDGDVYVVDFEQRVVDKFGPLGNLIGQLIVPKEQPSLQLFGVAVDSHGNPWVSDEQSGAGSFTHRRFDEFSNGIGGEFAKSLLLNETAAAVFGGSLLEGLALDTAGNFYAAISTGFDPGSTAQFDSKATLLTEALVEERPNGVASELPSSGVYLDNVSSVRRFDVRQQPPSEVERLGLGHLPNICTGSEIECEEPDRGGVAVDSTTGTVFVAVAPLDQVQVYPLEPPGPPTVEGESVSQVTADSAQFQANVNPRGAATGYRIEYGPCSGAEETCSTSPYGHRTPQPDGQLGADFEQHQVEAQAQELLAGTVYHFRVVAHSVLAGEPHETVGSEQQFTTQPAGVSGLADGRAWEMVSPPQKQGSLIVPIGEATPIQAAVSGDAITYPTHSPTEAQTLGYTNFVQVISSRGADGWSSKDITVPHERATGQSVGKGNEYRFSSEDLSQGIVQPFGAFVTAISPHASEQTAFLHSNFPASSPTAFCTSGCFTPLATAKNTPEGTAFGEEGRCPPELICGPLFVGASGDLHHVILSSHVGLSEAPGDIGGLYEWSAGTLQLISVLPGGKPASDPIPTLTLGYQNHVARNAVSPDGQRVVWSDESTHHLYLRDLGQPESVELDKGLSGEPVFQTASGQTTRVFFTEAGDLYEYDSETGLRTQLTSGAKVQGFIAGVSEDGTSVFLVADGELTKGEGSIKGNCQGDAPTPTLRCNLYELHESDGTWQPHLITVLSGADFPDFSEGGQLPALTTRVSPNGRYLAFMSQLSLTGYDNHDATSARPDEEVFLYDASTRHLTCASCNPTGARPQGIESKRLTIGGPVQRFGATDGTTWLAASVPGWTEYRLLTSLYQSRYLSNSGRLFFNSSDALSPQDVNGTEDVYEWEPPGVGGCEVGGAGYGARSGGCVGLISKGTSREESGFLDASETGADVFFTTTSKLTSQDVDGAYDIYDAHECTPSSPCIAPPSESPPPCSGESSCKAGPSPQPQIFGPPASATFSGPGNLIAEIAAPTTKPKPLTTAQKLAKALRACRAKYRHSKRRRRGCEAVAHRRYRVAAKNANGKRRTR